MNHVVKCIYFVIIAVLVEFPQSCFSEDANIVEFKAYLFNSLSNIQKHSDLLVTSSNVLWLANSGTNLIDTTEVSYLTSGEYYRTICRWPKPLDKNKEWQGSYNGLKSSTFTDRHGEIIYRKGESPDEVVVPINPVVGHLTFLSRAGDSCPLCLLRVQNIVRGEPFRLLEKSIITNTTASGAKVSTFLFPSGKVNESPAYWSIEFQNEDQPMIKTATRFIDHGKVRLVYSFLNYTNLESEEANISYPTLITMQDYHGSDIIMTGMTQVISVTLNPPIPTNAFDVMTDLDARAKQVFNADAETFDRIQRKFDAQDFQFARKRKIILIAFVILSAAGLFFIVRRART